MERPLLSESLAKVTFDDAAVYFSEEQWQNLEEFQKKIYKELIKEIYETMLALGYRIPKPEIVSRIERGEEPCVDPCKKPKQQETQPQGAPDGSKDSEPVIKIERESPEASAPVTPNEISSSQERGGAQCSRCGTCCNNQCGRMAFQWSGQGMYPGSPMDTNHGKPYMTPPPSYFNGSPISYNNRGEGMSHPTSPMASYGNAGMVPLSPHYAGPGYRNAAEPSSPFQMPERPTNPVFAFEQMPMGPPASHVDLDNRNRNPHMQNAMFHDRRNPVPPCPGCGAYCNNQCGMNVHWEQRRLHHQVPGPVDVAQGHRYTSPPNPYFSGGANPASFSNIRPPVRHGTPPVNVQGNSGMIQMSAPYPGYRRPGDKSPNVFPNKPEHHGNNTGAASPHHGPNQGVKYGMVPANNSGNYRKSQSISPLAAIETMPVFSSNNSPGAVGDQRNRPLPQTVTSSDNNRDRNTMNSYTNGRQNQLNFSNHGAKITRVQPATSATGNTAGQLKSGDTAGNKSSMPSDGGGTASKNTFPSSSSFIGQVVEQVILNESHAAKRSAVQTASESGIPTKRASPTVIIVDCDEEKCTQTQKATGNNNPGSACVTLSTTKSSLPSAPVAGGSHDSKKTPPPENKRPETPPITISNVRSGGLFLTPPSKGIKETMKDSGPIIIIDDKDGEGAAPPRASPASSSNKAVTPPVPNTKVNKEPSPAPPPASSTNTTMQPQGGQQGAAVLVNKVQMQQPSPIIVTGGAGLGNQPLSVPVNGNQSIMLTFPVTVGSSGIMLATPMTNRVPISKNTRLVPTNTVTASRNVNPKFSSVAVTPVIGQTNTLPVAVPPGHAKPVAINVNQSSNLTGAINIKNTNVNGGTLKAVPVSAAGNQTIPLFVDANSGLILTGSAVPSKDNVPSSIGNATVVAVNRGVVAGNVAPVTLGGKLAFGNIAPVNGLYIGGNSPVALAGNANKGTLSINNPTILTLNGGLGIGNSRSVTAPIANIASVNANRTLQVAQATASSVVGGASQQNNTVILRKIDEKSGVSNQAGTEQQPAVVVERLFKCSECDEKFNSLENLTSHRAIHKPREVPAGGHVGQSASKDSGDNEALPRTGDNDAPTILYTTQGDDGSTVYVVTV
ncbi:uncharacterized protein LOC130272844 [Hyla sarda]|uniref:uncharacterized protein LOC130272844 n=1 Tax=Hyla sarda TaxID=327740 RepID=UPI0024C2AF48|nr:uncharacterized protein LOC130272844 [Hyla sarda]